MSGADRISWLLLSGCYWFAKYSFKLTTPAIGMEARGTRFDVIFSILLDADAD